MAIIGKIRKRAGIAVAVIAIAILSFVFSDIFTRSSNVPNNIATIDGVEITCIKFIEVSIKFCFWIVVCCYSPIKV